MHKCGLASLLLLGSSGFASMFCLGGGGFNQNTISLKICIHCACLASALQRGSIWDPSTRLFMTFCPRILLSLPTPPDDSGAEKSEGRSSNPESH